MNGTGVLQALLGGALIGGASALLLWSHGRIAGISGITAGALSGNRDGAGFRYAFLAGLLATGAVLGVLWPSRFESLGIGTGVLLAAGILVGLGTRLGGGCTSGHGVCGVGRGSRRSIIATLTFMLSAALTVFLTRHA